MTRFLGLAAVGNEAKQKSLHALKLQPASAMDAATLQSKPAGSTPCPYLVSRKRPAEEEGMDGQVLETYEIQARDAVQIRHIQKSNSDAQLQ